jgi:hypothetical protein
MDFPDLGPTGGSWLFARTAGKPLRFNPLWVEVREMGGD